MARDEPLAFVPCIPRSHIRRHLDGLDTSRRLRIILRDYIVRTGLARKAQFPLLRHVSAPRVFCTRITRPSTRPLCSWTTTKTPEFDASLRLCVKCRCLAIIIALSTATSREALKLVLRHAKEFLNCIRIVDRRRSGAALTLQGRAYQ